MVKQAASLTPAKMKNLLVKILKEHQALEVRALKVAKLTDLTDYLIIATANSAAHARALLEKSREALAEVKLKPLGIEGEETKEWILVDFGSVIVHLMLKSIREFYSLEKLWDLTNGED